MAGQAGSTVLILSAFIAELIRSVSPYSCPSEQGCPPFYQGDQSSSCYYDEDFVLQF
jgi:hypothetical protein